MIADIPTTLGYPALEDEVRPLLKTEQTAFYLQVKEQTLRLWASTGEGPIRPVRVGGALRWPTAQLRDLLGVPRISQRDAAAYGLGYWHGTQRTEPLHPVVPEATGPGAQGAAATEDNPYHLGILHGLQMAFGEQLSETVPWVDLTVAVAKVVNFEVNEDTADSLTFDTSESRDAFMAAVLARYRELHPEQSLPGGGGGISQVGVAALLIDEHDVSSTPGDVLAAEEAAS